MNAVDIAAAAAPAAAKVKTAAHPCECGLFETLVNVRPNDTDGDLVWDEEFTTGCGGATTLRTFAPGHDARLKGFLIKMGARGEDVDRVDGGVRIGGDALGWAHKYGFGSQVSAGIENALAKIEARKAKETARQEAADLRAAQKAAKVSVKAASALAADTAKAQADMQATADAASAKLIADALADAQAAADAEAAVAATASLVQAKVGRWTYDGVHNEAEGTFSYESKGVAKTVTTFTLI